MAFIRVMQPMPFAGYSLKLENSFRVLYLVLKVTSTNCTML
jgi:hypothetical protein